MINALTEYDKIIILRIKKSSKLEKYAVGNRKGPCLINKLSKSSQGYPRISYRGTLRQVNRVLYELIVGPVPYGKILDITCDVPECVNPFHMQPLSKSEKMHRTWDRRKIARSNELDDIDEIVRAERVYTNPNTGLPF